MELEKRQVVVEALNAYAPVPDVANAEGLVLVRSGCDITDLGDVEPIEVITSLISLFEQAKVDMQLQIDENAEAKEMDLMCWGMRTSIPMDLETNLPRDVIRVMIVGILKPKGWKS